MRPVVGVMPLWDEEKESLWMLPGYLDGLRQAGGLPIILPLSDDPAELTQLAALCSGFLFTGGQDVSPEVYREPPHDLTEPCPLRDAMERRILEYALAEDKPVLGICRGIQFINAALGGTLYQDLPSQHPSDTVHRQPPPYERPVHNVAVRADTPLHRCLGVSALPVNSLHHQAVKDLAPGLEPMAAAPDGVIEALYRPDSRFLWAVQWHPEFSFRAEEASRKIFRAFVAAME